MLKHPVIILLFLMPTVMIPPYLGLMWDIHKSEPYIAWVGIGTLIWLIILSGCWMYFAYKAFSED